MTTKTGQTLKRQDSGVALILVMLAILVLTTLAAAMVFSARSETFASYNYRIATQAEYVARAGAQRALNYFNSAGYVPLPPPAVGSETTYYNLSTYAVNPVNLYFANTAPVQCTSSCSSSGSVTLGTSTGSSHYPPASATPDSSSNPVNVVSNWVNAMNNQSISDGRPGSLEGTGSFTVTATLLDYHTVNNGFLGVPATGCSSDPAAPVGICRKSYEVWKVRSVGTWNSNIGAAGQSPTVEIVATIAPMFVPYFGNALYGLCNVTLHGNTCTDSYNSSVGAYIPPSGETVNACVWITSGTSTNGAAANAGVGSNGGVVINGTANQIGGNVTFANSPPAGCSSTGFTGSDTSVAGSILPGPAVPAPPTPNMVPWGYNPTNSTAPNVQPSGPGGMKYKVANVFFRATPPVAAGCTAGTTGYIEKYYIDRSGSNWIYGASTYTCLTGAGTSSDPYRLGEISASGTSSTPESINFIGPSTGAPLTNPIYVAANEVEISGTSYVNLLNAAPAKPATTSDGTPNPNPTPSTPYVAVVLDVADHVSLSGNGVMNYYAAAPGTPSPDTLMLNVLGTANNAVDLGGQSALSAMVNAPNGGVNLSGSGAGGTFFGSILAKYIDNGGHYAVHYDLSMRNQSGQMFSAQVVSVTRPKM